jgi:Putative addiction module component
MSAPVDDLEAQAMRLPPEDRARLLERLLASFEPLTPAQTAWNALASQRRDEVHSGHRAMEPGPAALDRVRARLG